MILLVVCLIILLIFLILSVSVASSIAAVALLVGNFFSDYPVMEAIGDIAWGTSTDFILFSIPLFVLLGELLLHSGIARKLYFALYKWLYWLPGGLLHVNVASSAIFSSISGSSVATAATITTIAMPEGKRFGYKSSMFAGSIAAGGTLGILIPPSINLIIYGFLTNTSVPKLFIAGLIPGLLMAFCFMLYIFLVSLTNKDKYSKTLQDKISWSERWIALKDFIPIAILFLFIMGSIYGGLATPTEAAALGVIVALIIIAFNKSLNFEIIKKSVAGTIRTTGMIMLIIIAASILNFVLVTVGLSDELSFFINDLNVSKYTLLLIIALIFIVLGLFIETLSLMVIAIPILAPVIVEAGFDPIWLGVFIIILIETALITPPVGLNLYVVQGIRAEGSINEVIKGASPFVLIMIAVAFLLVLFPQIALLLV